MSGCGDPLDRLGTVHSAREHRERHGNRNPEKSVELFEVVSHIVYDQVDIRNRCLRRRFGGPGG